MTGQPRARQRRFRKVSLGRPSIMELLTGLAMVILSSFLSRSDCTATLASVGEALARSVYIGDRVIPEDLRAFIGAIDFNKTLMHGMTRSAREPRRSDCSSKKSIRPPAPSLFTTGEPSATSA